MDLLCTAPTRGVRNRAGREAAAAVAFSRCVCSSDRQTLGAFFIFIFPPHLTCHTVQQGAAQPGEVGTARGSTRAICYNQPVCERAWTLCVYSGWMGVWGARATFAEGYCIDASHAGVTEEDRETEKEPAASTLPVMLTSTMPVRVPMPLVASQTYVPARS